MFVCSVSNTDLPSSPTTFGVRKTLCFNYLFQLLSFYHLINLNSQKRLQEDEGGNIFVGTFSSELYLLRSTATVPSPTRSPTNAPTKAVTSPTFSPISVGVTCPATYEKTEVLSSAVELDYSVVLEAGAAYKGKLSCF